MSILTDDVWEFIMSYDMSTFARSVRLSKRQKRIGYTRILPRIAWLEPSLRELLSISDLIAPLILSLKHLTRVKFLPLLCNEEGEFVTVHASFTRAFVSEKDFEYAVYVGDGVVIGGPKTIREGNKETFFRKVLEFEYKTGHKHISMPLEYLIFRKRMSCKHVDSNYAINFTLKRAFLRMSERKELHFFEIMLPLNSLYSYTYRTHSDKPALHMRWKELSNRITRFKLDEAFHIANVHRMNYAM